jgi:hypothetical protein
MFRDGNDVKELFDGNGKIITALPSYHGVSALRCQLITQVSKAPENK